MRRGDAKPRRAARLTTTAKQHPWSARATPARVQREAQYPNPRAKAKLSLDVTTRGRGGV
jgi:hypothetical protein